MWDVRAASLLHDNTKARGSFLLRALWYHEASAYFINIIFLLFTNFCPDAPVAVMR